MKFGNFFLEVCNALRNQFHWVAPETIVTQKTQCLDVMYQEYTLAMSDVQNAPTVGSRQADHFVDQAIRSRINTTAFQINELKKDGR